MLAPIKLADSRGWGYLEEVLLPPGMTSSRPPLDGVIVGGESGPGARAMHPDWVRSLRDECYESRVPFFFKQWGEWEYLGDSRLPTIAVTNPYKYRSVGEARFFRIGKKAAGRILDGRTWDKTPW
jgi:protein gp37